MHKPLYIFLIAVIVFTGCSESNAESNNRTSNHGETANGPDQEDKEDETQETAEQAPDVSAEVKSTLDKFKDIDGLYSIEYDEKSYSVAPEGGNNLTSEEQIKVLGMGGYDNEEGFGMHITALGKMKLSPTKFVLVYKALMVPVPAMSDEVGLTVFDVQHGSGESMSFAYLRGTPGEGTQIMTGSIKKEGDSVHVYQTLKDRTEIMTDEGIEDGPTFIYDIRSIISKDGSIKELNKKKIAEE